MVHCSFRSSSVTYSGVGSGVENLVWGWHGLEWARITYSLLGVRLHIRCQVTLDLRSLSGMMVIIHRCHPRARPRCWQLPPAQGRVAGDALGVFAADPAGVAAAAADAVAGVRLAGSTLGVFAADPAGVAAATDAAAGVRATGSTWGVFAADLAGVAAAADAAAGVRAAGSTLVFFRSRPRRSSHRHCRCGGRRARRGRRYGRHRRLRLVRVAWCPKTW